jgi:hypothetical protein
MSAPAPEAIVVAGYAAFLVLAAGLLDLAARHTHARAERFRIAGFDFDHRLDAWRCPEGQHLHRVETDLAARVARYRAAARICNSCPSKPGCTDSNAGREVVRPLDPWPWSEAGRFHRGICVVLLALAALLLAIELARHHAPAEVAMCGGLLAIVVALGLRAGASFRTTPTGFPAGSVTGVRG